MASLGGQEFRLQEIRVQSGFLEDVWAVSCVFKGSVLALGAPELPAA